MQAMTQQHLEPLATADLLNMDPACFKDPAAGLRLHSDGPSHPPRILLLQAPPATAHTAG